MNDHFLLGGNMHKMFDGWIEEKIGHSFTRENIENWQFEKLSETVKTAMENSS